MKFLVLGKNENRKTVNSIDSVISNVIEDEYPTFILLRDYFDDYTFKTSYVLFYATSASAVKKIGGLRILDIDNKITELEDKFTKLDKNRFCSLGETLEFYETLMTLGATIFDNVTKSLNDSFVNEKVHKKFSVNEGYRVSLLRYTSTQSLFLLDREKLFQKINSQFFVSAFEGSLVFNFSTKLKYALSAHSISFNFSNRTKYDRIRVLIGKNGSGKTSYLKNLALALSGENRAAGIFTPSHPTVGPTIMLSYSAFDSFQMPSQDNNSYIYCGLNFLGRKVSHEDILMDIESNFLRLREGKKFDLFLEILKKSNLFYEEQLFLNEDTRKIGSLSSGQAILLKYITDIIKNIQENSMILIDEIETHLHPNFLIGLLKFLAEILYHFNSYCILSTHSPLVVQETDLSRAYIFNRVGNDIIIFQKDMNYISESLNIIIDEVFELTPRDHFYSDVLREVKLNKLHNEFNLNPIARALVENNANN